MGWSGTTALVTGAGGFIGSHLTERLVALGARTRALVRYASSGSWGWLDVSPAKEDVQVTAGDVRDRDSLRGAFDGVDVVFHLAALVGIPWSYRSPISYVRTNVEGTLNVLQAALDEGVSRVVHTSTSEVYGSARRVPIDEEHPLQAQSPYSASKIAGDKMAEAFHRAHGLHVVTVRPFNAYGPRQSARAIIPTIAVQALARGEVRLGNLTPTRDLTYVEDTVDAFIRAATAPNAVGEVINVGTGKEISMEDLAKRVLLVLGRDVPVFTEIARARPPASEVDRLCADASRARSILGWTPGHSLDEGLRKTLPWIASNLERYRPDTYAI